MNPNNKYTKMQQNQYDQEANNWTIDHRDPVVGAFDAHNTWDDYDNFLFKNVETTNKIALDFGCGPGRNIVKFTDKFQRIDGVDISETNLKNAAIWCKHNSITVPNLFKTNGVDLQNITSNCYDIVLSTIVLQHICVHEIRFNFLKEFYRVLKPGGTICLQMGFGPDHPRSVDYFDNNYNALGTNSGCDTRVNDSSQIDLDLNQIGFNNFEYDIRPVGPGDIHSNWIFFRASK
jgi:ubiquinone/menaquinone biosynthesis C-methylase UbiE